MHCKVAKHVKFWCYLKINLYVKKCAMVFNTFVTFYVLFSMIIWNCCSNELRIQ